MAYRDDEEALHHRVDSLEVDLAESRDLLDDAENELKHHRAKDVRDETQIEGLQQEVARLRAKLGLTPPSPPVATSASHGRARTVLAIGILGVVASAGLVVWLGADKHPPAHIVARPPTEAVPSNVPGVVEPLPLPVASPPSTSPTDVALFGAEVISAEGRELRPGDGCVLVVGLAYGPAIGRVVVRCGAEKLYDSGDALGTSVQHVRTGIQEMSGPTPGTYVYAVDYTDYGARAGPRSQIVATSEHHAMRVYDEGPQPFSVTFLLQDWSVERSGVPLSAYADSRPTPFSKVLHVRARPRARTGPVPRAVADASSCELRVRPHAVDTSPHNCRFTLACGGELIYGAGTTGYSRCTVEAGFPVAADDGGTTLQNQDPIMHFNWRERSLTVEDDRGAERWTVELALDEHPSALRFDGTWDGFSIDETGAERELLLRAAGRNASLTWRATSGTGEHEGEWNADPLVGDLVVDVAPSGDGGASRRYEVSYGPGFATLVGRAMGEGLSVLGLSRRADDGSM